ncbi:hypothetical protein KEJ21_00350 [Candidatus Bathyarchaeota archaeon]|nr:hypothetical protein [Candidatus Bathyarchaeota archaeon]MBS7630011.1 hypothetical protein [Candidatus Bathyarchaeota archaeon]
MRSLEENKYSEGFDKDLQGLVVEGSPGRVNIIGEHTDYDEGFVPLMPINMNVWVAGKPQEKRTIKFIIRVGLF